MAKLSNAPTSLTNMADFPDVFVEGIGRIDDGGTVSHLIFYVRQIMDGRTYRMTALRVIVPTAALPLMARQLASPDMADISAEDMAFCENELSLHVIRQTGGCIRLSPGPLGLILGRPSKEKPRRSGARGHPGGVENTLA
jgi:hypothetical protein